jgi:hypothetical protein
VAVEAPVEAVGNPVPDMIEGDTAE